MDAYERRLEVLAAQIVPHFDEMQQLALNPTSAADLVNGDLLMAEGDAYAVALPEVLEGEGSWDVYR
jgi:hypothetical protein